MSTIDRRRFCAIGGAALAAPFGGRHAAANPASGKMPNILYCLADDWSFPHAAVYGDNVIKVPTFERVAREGVLFTHVFSAAPTCSASRAAMLTGQAPHRLAEGANLFGFLPKRFPVYPDYLEEAGYKVGYTRKGWGPGSIEAGGRTRNPAGNVFKDFAAFLKQTPQGKPFCFWFGSYDPHRPYAQGSGAKSGMKLADVRVPPMWPDTPEVRGDILDYYFATQRFDREVGGLLDLLESTGQAENTLVVMSGDNGWPFPRCKANLYDGGTRQPLAVRWPGRIKPGRTLDDFINLTDLAPTFLEAAGLTPPPEMTGRSFVKLVTGEEKPGSRNTVFLERERHASSRKGLAGYPMRAVRTREYLYIRNIHPDRWPAGDPSEDYFYGPFGDCDPGGAKTAIVTRHDEKEIAPYYELCFGKRPAEELFDVRNDPHNLTNLAADASYAGAKDKMRAMLDRWMKDTADPRATSDDDPWDRYEYFGEIKGR
jgi:arylsulfatase A-like enzyme